jgi:hypothetical protein
MRQLAARTDICGNDSKVVSTVRWGHRRLADPVRSTMARREDTSAIPVKLTGKKSIMPLTNNAGVAANDQPPLVAPHCTLFPLCLS